MFLSLLLIKLKLDNFVNKVQSSSQLSATTPYCLIGNSTMGKRVSKSGNFKSYFVSWNEICILYFWEVWAHFPDFPCFINFRRWWYKQRLPMWILPRCDQQLTCLVGLLKICDIMGTAIFRALWVQRAL